MKNTKIILALMLILTLLLCACTPQTDGGDDTTAAADTTTAPADTTAPDTDEPEDTEEPEDNSNPFENTAMLINDGKPCVVIVADADAGAAAKTISAILLRYGAVVETFAPDAEIPDMPRITVRLDPDAPAGTLTLCPDEYGLLVSAPDTERLQAAADLLVSLVDAHATGGMTGYSVTIPSEELQYIDSTTMYTA